jgi:hypothetical protein
LWGKCFLHWHSPEDSPEMNGQSIVLDLSSNRSVNLLGCGISICARCSDLNPARYSQHPVNRIMGFILPATKSPTVSIWDVKFDGSLSRGYWPDSASGGSTGGFAISGL